VLLRFIKVVIVLLFLTAVAGSQGQQLPPGDDAQSGTLRIAASHARENKEYDKAISLYGESIQKARAAGNQLAEGRSLFMQGYTYWKIDRYFEARESLEKALPLLEPAGQSDLIPESRFYLGHTYSHLGELAKARTMLEKALPDLDDRKALAMQMLASVALKQGDYASAESFATQAAALYHTAKNLSSEALSLQLLAMVQQAQSNNSGAIETRKKVLTLLRALQAAGDSSAGLNERIAQQLSGMGSNYENIGSKDKAMESYLEALAVEKKSGLKRAAALTNQTLGVFYGSRSEYSKAQMYLQAAAEDYAETGQLSEELDICLLQGDYDVLAGDATEAQKTYSLVINRAKSAGLAEQEGKARD
jgi:tetratricopeptide (TPR) repeat protein